MFKLKTGVENFSVVEGPFAGKHFKRGESYAEVPAAELRKFEEIGVAAAPGKAAPPAAREAAKIFKKSTKN